MKKDILSKYTLVFDVHELKSSYRYFMTKKEAMEYVKDHELKSYRIYKNEYKLIKESK